jgi:hypothetical protein
MRCLKGSGAFPPVIVPESLCAGAEAAIMRRRLRHLLRLMPTVAGKRSDSTLGSFDLMLETIER